AAYLLSRVFQVFAPGIPQIYYVGLLAGENDIALLESSKEGRNINRHYYTVEEAQKEAQRPVVVNLLKVLSWRNRCAAFDLDGFIDVTTPSETTITITRSDKSGGHIAELAADAARKTFTITADGKVVMTNATTRE
ncbi:MAG: sucrose phosphorylase, partial [Spirochaetaceae bacterium]|nr:sucrose phosphorylase [Spirochaetaceae bacterium]